MIELKFKPKSRVREFLGEKLISLNAFAALIGVLLIFVFIFKEAVPIFTNPEIKKEVTVGKMVFKQEFYKGRAPKYSWQPNSDVPKYSLLPSVIGDD